MSPPTPASPNNPFALLGVIGLDCPGAVQFVPQGSDACRDEDKDLRNHGLIQAFSRTNRILNSVKTYGNIVCFRNLEDHVNHTISFFGDNEAGGIVLLKPYAEYLGEYCERLAQLREQFPLEAVLNGNALLGEEAEKAFIRLFDVILRLRNILTAFDDFATDDTLSPRDEQDYRSVYTDLYQRWRKQKELRIRLRSQARGPHLPYGEGSACLRRGGACTRPRVLDRQGIRPQRRDGFPTFESTISLLSDWLDSSTYFCKISG